MLSVLVALLLWQEIPETVAMAVILPLLILAFLQAVGRAAIQWVILLEVLPARPLQGLFFQWSGKVVRGRSAPWAVWVERLTAVMVVFLTSAHLEMMVSSQAAAVLVHHMTQSPGHQGRALTAMSSLRSTHNGR
ncbi:TPA: hypothetical protein OMD60_005604 [Klebsiella pneumoniae]|nr:hypothetical protein [Klebsiella pneumoniae]EKV8137391.1 hypothetical protein [Klebsiella pneumoniae]HBR6079961.1 hypothetical protein [Klebsiella pneumoniae]HCD2759679.1 hypothetical protein [Klebsiella pneumoniae]HCQ6656694.1 hypothetical protein [Klebsiella pneumoniae]